MGTLGPAAPASVPVRPSAPPEPSPLTPIVASALRLAAQHPRPAAVFDADGTMWGPRDAGLQFLRWLADSGHLTTEGQRHANKLLPVVPNGTSPTDALASLAKSLVGLREEDVASLAQRFVRAHLVPAIFRPMQEAARALQAGGVDVRIVSAAPQPLLEAIAPYLEIPTRNVHGARVEVKDGLLTDQLAGPIPYGDGKPAVIRASLPDGNTIVLGAGDTASDSPMLRTVHPEGARLLVNASPKEVLPDAVHVSLHSSQTRGAATARGALGHYGDRPDIRALDARTPTKSTAPLITPQTRRYWAAELEMVAKLVEMYPDRELYFLARDAEGLGDMARLLGTVDPAVAARVHLLNVSTQSVKDPHLLDYLAQEGLSAEAVRSGKKYLFVDTGFRGSIPKALAALFTAQRQGADQFQTHMIFAAVDTTHFPASDVSHLPNSRVFVGAVDPTLTDRDYDGSCRTNASAMTLVQAYALLPKATPKATTYKQFDGHWQPVGEGADRYDGAIDLHQATVQMQAKKAWFESPKIQSMLQHRRTIWRAISELQRESRAEPLIALLRELAAQPGGTAVVRDALELFSTNLDATATRVSFSDVGLMPQAQHASVTALEAAVYGRARLESPEHVSSLWATQQYEHLAQAIEHLATRADEIAALRRAPPATRMRLEAMMKALAAGMAGLPEGPSTPRLTALFAALEDRGLYHAYGEAAFNEVNTSGRLGSAGTEILQRASAACFDQLLSSFQYQVQSRPDEPAAKSLPTLKLLVSAAHERRSPSPSLAFLELRLLQTRDPAILDPILLAGIARRTAASHRRTGSTPSAARSYDEIQEVLELPAFGSAFDTLRRMLADPNTESRTRALLEAFP